MSLVAEERKQNIVQLLEQHGKVRVSDLANRLHVSTETIRRHLDDLEAENRLKKVYGGAIKIHQQIEPPHHERSSIQEKAKHTIGRLAAEQVSDYDVIYIDEGSTPLPMIPHLISKKQLTIMTTSIPALNMLMEYTKKERLDARIIFIGGEVNTDHLRTSGPIAEKMLEDFFVTKAFLVADGIEVKSGITSYDPNKALVTKKLITHTEESFVLADHTKINHRTYAKMASLEDVTAVICDESAPEHFHLPLERQQTRWISPAAEE